MFGRMGKDARAHPPSIGDPAVRRHELAEDAPRLSYHEGVCRPGYAEFCVRPRGEAKRGGCGLAGQEADASLGEDVVVCPTPALEFSSTDRMASSWEPGLTSAPSSGPFRVWLQTDFIP
jgi:hypothetical protein